VDDQDNKGGLSSMRTAISTLPPWAWGVAGLLALLPAAGFHLIIASLTPRSEPSFIFFYWIAALYVLLRKTDRLGQMLRRIGVLVGLELVILAVVRFLF
jgi:hypothetical protein